MKSSTFVVGVSWCLAVSALGACGGGRMTTSDGGPGTDAGPTPGLDSGPSADHFTGTVSGAHGVTIDYTESHSLSGNYVTCSNPGFLAITAAATAGTDPSVNIYLHGYTGPDTYNLTYHPGSADSTSVEVRTGGGYAYLYSFDDDSTTFAEVDSTCTFVIEQASGSTTAIHGTVDCTNLTADITSPDYEDPQMGLQPKVTFHGTFDCNVD